MCSVSSAGGDLLTMSAAGFANGGNVRRNVGSKRLKGVGVNDGLE